MSDLIKIGVRGIIADFISAIVLLLIENALNPILSQIEIYPVIHYLVWSAITIVGLGSIIIIVAGILEQVKG